MEATFETSKAKLAIAKCVGPEDLVRGDYVAVSRFATEYASFMWDETEFSLPRESTIKVWWTSGCSAIAPYKISDICLPFLLVKSFDRKWTEIDVRQIQLMKLDQKFAKQVRRKLRQQSNALLVKNRA